MFLSLGAVPNIFTTLQKNRNYSPLMGCCYANVALTLNISALWQKQRFNWNGGSIINWKCLCSGKRNASIGKRAGFHMCLMLVFTCTLKSPITIAGNLDWCVRWPGSFSEGMHLQFLLNITKLSRMAITCNLTCNRLRSKQMSKSFKKTGMDCSTVILIFLIPLS